MAGIEPRLARGSVQLLAAFPHPKRAAFPGDNTELSTSLCRWRWYGIGMDDDRRQAQYNGALHEAPRPALAADGTPRLPHVAYDDDGYAYDDGEPLGQSKQQIDQLFYAFPALEKLVGRRFPGAFAASDMFVYHKRGREGRAPDIFVAFDVEDVPNRLSYKVFEGNPVPSFVLEVLSHKTAEEDLGPKREDYAAWGVAEYWIFDPYERHVAGHIRGERLGGDGYEPIAPRPGTAIFASEVLRVELRAEGGRLRIHDPESGEDLRHYGEEFDAREAAEERAAAEAAARKKAEERVKALEAELAELRRARSR